MPRLIAALTMVFTVAACSTAAVPSTATPTTTTASSAPTTVPPPPTPPPPTTGAPLEHLVGTIPVGDLTAELYAPAEPGPWPVAVTVHGGGWVTGFPAATAPLADALAERGIVAVNVSYRTVSTGGGFPTSVDDVACAVAAARAAANAYTTTPDQVVLIGHSAGAHLAALVALAPGEFGGDCAEDTSKPVDGFVGLSGPYDIELLGPVGALFFGVSLADDPARWARGNPLTYVESSPEIPVLLLHGDSDQLVPLAFSRELANLLEGAGRPVTFEILPGGTHDATLDPAVVADRIADFVTTGR